MITINDEEYRNLQEQVLKNQCDIQAMKFGLNVVGFVDTVPELPSDIEIGEAIGVGQSYPYYFYVKIAEPKIYVNVGTLQGIRGEEGPMGHEGIQGVDGTKWLYGYGEPSMSAREGDLYIDTENGNVFSYDLKNAWIPITHLKGPQGPIGKQGIPGPQGPRGYKGDKGDVGSPLNILGERAREEDLPSAGSLPTNSAFIVGTSSTGYDIYVIVGVDSKYWKNIGAYSNVDKEYVDSKSMVPGDTWEQNLIKYDVGEDVSKTKSYFAPANGYITIGYQKGDDSIKILQFFIGYLSGVINLSITKWQGFFLQMIPIRKGQEFRMRMSFSSGTTWSGNDSLRIGFLWSK